MQCMLSKKNMNNYDKNHEEEPMSNLVFFGVLCLYIVAFCAIIIELYFKN